MAVPVYIDLDLQVTSKVTGLASPTNASDATHKTYVDLLVATTLTTASSDSLVFALLFGES